MSKPFSYFAYGSNMLAHRIHINNPTATRYGIGKINNYRLDFGTYSTKWNGAAATIVPTEGHEVWGAIWHIDFSNQPNLDKQEGVDCNIYFPFDIDVFMNNGSVTTCRVYQQTTDPTFIPDLDALPNSRLPSAAYLRTILLGAEESNLPFKYMEFLQKIRHNGYTGKVDITGLKLDKNV